MERMMIINLFFAFCMVIVVYADVKHQCVCKEGVKMIDCSSRNFRTVTVLNNCSNVNKIDLSNNSLSIFPEEVVKSYEFINISKNTLNSLESHTGLKVKVLDVSENNIETIKLGSSFKYLEELIAFQNKLDEAKNGFLSSSCYITFLDVSKNHLKSLESLNSCQNLSRLVASHNEIQSLPNDFENLNSLTFIDLSNNDIETVSYLPMNLTKINLSQNKITQVQSESFQKLPMLVDLDLSHNYITEIEQNAFTELHSLTRLNLSGNRLQEIPLLQLNAEVQSLLLVDNQIDRINADTVFHLLSNSTEHRLLDLRDNPVPNDDPGLLTLIRRLDSVGATVDENNDCSCINATVHSSILLLCVKMNDDACWVDLARQTTTAMTTTTAPIIVYVNGSSNNANDTFATNTSHMEANDTAPSIMKINAAELFTKLDAAKLSFIAFLILTLFILIIVNYVVGDPVMDNRWWEEKLRGERVVT